MTTNQKPLRSFSSKRQQVPALQSLHTWPGVSRWLLTGRILVNFRWKVQMVLVPINHTWVSRIPGYFGSGHRDYDECVMWCDVESGPGPALNTRQRWWGMAASPGVRAQSMTQHPVARLPYHVKQWPSSETILYEMMHELYYNKGMRLLRISTSKVLRNCERFILANI